MTEKAAAIRNLKLHAISALERARRLPIGPDRNDLRQLAKNLRMLADNRNEQIHPERSHDHAPIHHL